MGTIIIKHVERIEAATLGPWGLATRRSANWVAAGRLPRSGGPQLASDRSEPVNRSVGRLATRVSRRSCRLFGDSGREQRRTQPDPRRAPRGPASRAACALRLGRRATLANLPVLRAYQAHYSLPGRRTTCCASSNRWRSRAASCQARAAHWSAPCLPPSSSSLLLTAGHDVAALAPPLVVDCSRAGDRFVGISGQERELKPGDMLMRDGLGIISAVLNGPDQRTRLSGSTSRALFVTYAPSDVPLAAIHAHLDEIVDYVRLSDPQSETVQRLILSD